MKSDGRSKRFDPGRIPDLVSSGSTAMVGGFGLVGAPLSVLGELAKSGVTSLTIVANNLGEPGLGLGALLRNGQVRHAIGSFFTSNPDAVAAIANGAITVELIPQGTLAEAIRAGGAGIPGFFTPTSAGTTLAANRDVRTISSVECVFQPAIRGDVALIKADRADELGNLTYRMTARNFNPAMATAADIVIAEVEEIVPVGSLSPDDIVTPHLFVDYLVEARTRREDLGTSSVTDAMRDPTDTEIAMAARVRKELRAGQVVNLGIGLPALVVRFIKPEDSIFIHTENGLLGAGPPPEAGSALEYPVDAAKHPLTELPGAAYFDSADSFAMIRGGHIDVAVMGALQVDRQGTLANWAVPPKTYGVGGAMDLAAGAQRVIVMMSHLAPNGSSKIVEQCSLPVTARNCVDTVITDMGLFRTRDGALILEEIMPGHSIDEIRAATATEFAYVPHANQSA
ncbi:MAG TPA: 3-oxoacid CoA-transferase [Chloroflexota bacterium]|jgi:3-oxoacid CoA-transferase|nr:3-oxoacid CoA-transferase [Chloroflexota bacterium]